MDTTLTYIAISLSLLLLATLFLSYATKNKSLSPPSPPSLPIIGHLHLIGKPLHQSLARLSARYGPILALRFGSRPVLVISSLSLAQECFTTNDIALANRVQLPTARRKVLNYSGIGGSNYGPHWRNIRRIATVEVLSAHRIASFTGVRTSEVHGMIKRLYKESKGGAGAGGTEFNRVELKSRLFEFTLNNMMMMIAGKRYFGENTSSVSDEEVKKFQETVEGLFATAGASNISNFLPVLKLLDLKGAKEEVNYSRYLDEMLQELIDEIRTGRNDNGKKSMIGNLLSLQETDPQQYTDLIIKSILSSLIVAGTDTSAATTEWTMSLLLNNPEKLAKAQEEIDRHVKSTDLLQESDLPSLPYLEAVITETLRIRPTAPLLVPHESAQECVVGGYKIRAGTMLLVDVHSIHRDPSTWSEPDKFIPERFEEITEEMRHKLVLAFGMGRRKCPGEGLAHRVVGLLVGTLIQCFQWERVGEELVDMTEGSGLTMPKAVPLEAMYRPRKTMEDLLSTL